MVTLMPPQLDWDLPLRIRGTRQPVRLLSSEALKGGSFVAIAISVTPHNEMLGLASLVTGDVHPAVHHVKAEQFRGSSIENFAPRHRRWVNIYKHSGSLCVAFESREEADRSSGMDRMACIEIEFEEGEGL